MTKPENDRSMSDLIEENSNLYNIHCEDVMRYEVAEMKLEKIKDIIQMNHNHYQVLRRQNPKLEEEYQNVIKFCNHLLKEILDSQEKNINPHKGQTGCRGMSMSNFGEEKE